MNHHEMCIAIVDYHLKELGIKRECEVEFLPSDRKGVLLPDNVLGLYIPAERTAYVREVSLPSMAETLAHEVAHDFLLHNSEIGRILVEHDILIRMHRNGEISAEVQKDYYKTLYLISRFVNEGFASFAGCYVLNAFSKRVMSDYELEDSLERGGLRFLQELFASVSAVYDNKPFDYYYGRLEFERISSIFGLENATLSAQISMNVKYDVEPEELLDYYLSLRREIYSGEDLSEPRLQLPLRFYVSVPHFRLLAISRLLPRALDAVYDKSGEYMVRLIERSFGREFLFPKIRELLLPISPVKLGYILGKYEVSGDASIFNRFDIPKPLLIRLKYGCLNLEEIFKESKEVYVGYLLSKLERASPWRAKEILKELLQMGVDVRDVLMNIDYLSEGEIREFVKRVLEKRRFEEWLE